MKPKKTLLIFAIILNVLALLFFVGFCLFYFDNDMSGFTDNLTYSEGIVKDVIQGTDGDRGYSVTLEENIVMWIDTDAIDSEGAFSYINKGDKVTFAVNDFENKITDSTVTSFVIPAFLSCNEKTVVSLESYEQSLVKNKNISAFLGLFGAIVFMIISAVLYFLWFKKRKKYKMIKNDY